MVGVEGIRADELRVGVGRAYNLMLQRQQGEGYKLMSCVVAWRGRTYELMHSGRR